MKKIYTLLLSGLCFSGFGQSSLESSNKLLPSITRPSPTVAQLMKVEESTLDHYTGQPQIAIPLFNTKAGSLEVDLTLSYNSSGIRIGDQSGWTGKGWTLETGGVISRSVVDLPDEIDTEIHRGANVNNLYEFFSYAEDSPQRRKFAYDAQWGTRIKIDTKTDIYQFSFFGRTGRFVFAKINNELQPAIIGNDGNYKIEAQYTTNSLPTMYPKEITTFIITDELGYKYYFTQIERTKKTDIVFTYMQEGCDSPTAPSFPPEIQKFITAWHLSKVEDANGIKQLDITYADVLEKPKKSESRTDYAAEDLGTVFSDTEQCTEYMRCALEPRTISSESSREINTKKISQINFPDGRNIRFSLSASHPEYLEGKSAYLTKIEIYNGWQSSAIKSFDFAYSNSNALFLDSIKINGSDLEKYTFAYYKKEEYPEFDTYYKDIFGYVSFSPGNDAMKTGVLTKITYPTKGVREFTWEPNTYSYKGDRLLTFREIFENPDNYTTAPVDVTDPFINAGTIRPYIIFNVNFEQDAFVYSSTTYLGSVVFPMPNFIRIIPIVSMSDQSVDPTRVDAGYPIGTNEQINRTVHLKPGAYKAYFWSLNVPVHEIDKISGNIDIRVKNPTPHLNWFLYGGGLRIKGIKDKDRGADQIVKGFDYNFENPGIIPTDLPPYLISPNGSYTLSFSSGSLDGIDNLIREYQVDINPIYNQLLRPYEPPSPIKYHVTEKQSEIDAQLQKGSFIGYKNVFEYFYPNVTSINNPIFKSKIRYVFDSPIDFPSAITTSSPPLPIRGDEYKQSNVRKIEYFGLGTGLLVSEDFKYNYDSDSIKFPVKDNVYFITNAASISGLCQQIRVLFPSYQQLVTNFISAGYDVECDGGLSTLPGYFMSLDKTQCLDHLSENYMSIKDYRYKSQVVERTKKEYFSSGIVETKETFSYRNDYKQLFMQTSQSSLGELLETKYFYAQDGEMAAAPYRSELISRNMKGVLLRTENYRNSGLLSIHETQYGLFTIPVDSPTPPAVGGNALLPQYILTGKDFPFFEKRLTFNQYDGRANILQYTQDSGVPVSFVWGYNRSEPVAKIDNMAYASLPTGLVSTVQNASNVTPQEAAQEASLLSALNDLRVAISAARGLMTGYSYKPLVGISTTIDPKGERTYYEYDAFGRLKSVRDRNGKLLSENDYHYRTQN
ncbi:hypothetical protein D3C87_42050 [compost metagenome]